MKRQPPCRKDHLRNLTLNFKGNKTTEKLFDIFWKLYNSFGSQYWWPGETPFEIAIGAILTQNTAWTNVEKAINNLKERKLLSPHKLFKLDNEILASLIRPTGYYNLKAKRLKNFLNFLIGRFDGSISKMGEMDHEKLRRELLKIKGIGPETADSIILYALGKPSFVIDAYTFRILLRHNLIDDNIDYHELRDIFMSNLPEDACLFNEFHALFVRLGKDLCKKGKPKCEICPLKDL